MTKNLKSTISKESGSALTPTQEKPTSRNAGERLRVKPETGVTKFTFYVNPNRALACLQPEAIDCFSLGFAADLTGVHPEMLRYYCRLGLLGADRAGTKLEITFDEEALQEVRRIEYYRRNLSISRRALPLICKLRRDAARQHIEIRILSISYSGS